jgi:hypothetical protein
MRYRTHRQSLVLALSLVIVPSLWLAVVSPDALAAPTGSEGTLLRGAASQIVEVGDRGRPGPGGGPGWGNFKSPPNNWRGNNQNWGGWGRNPGNYTYAVRPWFQRPYYGTFIGGIALGAILAATAYGIPPPPPAPYLCWYWTDPSLTYGYYDYCY